MGFSFIDIEEKKGRLIWVLFPFLIFFYFCLAWVLFIPFKIFLFIDFIDLKDIPKHLVDLPSMIETLMVFAVAALIGIIHWFYSIKRMVDKILIQIGAVPLDPNDSFHLRFNNIVQEASIAARGKKIEPHVIPSSSMNAFALADFNKRSVIGVTEGLIGKLNREQLESVVGHELGHILSGDCTMTTITSSIFGIYSAMMDRSRKLLSGSEDNDMRMAGEDGARRYILFLIIYIVTGITKGVSLLLNLFISRQREYRADAIAMRLTRNPLALAESLYLISRGWRGSSLGGEWLSNIFIVSPAYYALDESEGMLSDLFSTHPPVRKRIAILLDMAHMDEQSLIQTLKSKSRTSPRLSSAVTKELPSGVDRVLLNGIVRHVFPSGDKTPKSGSCPRCMRLLTEVFYEGAPILRCDQCGGYLVSKDKILRILTRTEQGFSPYIVLIGQIIQRSTQKMHFNKKSLDFRSVFEFICPQCGRKMKRKFYSLAYPVEVDVCSKCGLTWFDKDELEIIQFLVEDACKEGK